MKKLLVLLCMVCLVLSIVAVAKDKAPSKGSAMTGWISDEKCSAKVAKNGSLDEAGAACAKKCVEGGDKVVFVNDKDHSVVAIHNPEAVKGHEGHHVTVTGSMMDNALHVADVKMAMGAKKGAAKGKM